MGPKARDILLAIAEVTMPRSDEFYLAVEDKLVDFVEDATFHLTPLLRRLFPLGLYLFEYLAILSSFSFKPFTQLSIRLKKSYFNSWVHSRLYFKRELIKGIKGLVLFGYYSQPEVWDHLGYDPISYLEGLRS